MQSYKVAIKQFNKDSTEKWVTEIRTQTCNNSSQGGDRQCRAMDILCSPIKLTAQRQEYIYNVKAGFDR